ncbi:MAG: hypothetical protein M3464_19600 [Chloroflexota bacterium]|nr:hypothetical protein [Chloroflexota bacterium]
MEPPTHDETGRVARPRSEERIDLMSGARGAAVAIAVSVLLVVGLWAVARNAPSAGTDPRLLPSANAVGSPRPEDLQRNVTFVPGDSPASGAATAEAGEQ